MQVQKVKSVAKTMFGPGKRLSDMVLTTMEQIASIVGATLGPGGRPILIERQENMPPMVTKDGVTVFKNLGFVDPTSQVVLEAARDAAVRTAVEAGDGTTTATILAYHFVKNTMEICNDHKHSPQKIVRGIQKAFKDKIEPFVTKNSFKVNLQAHKSMLHAVATVSANGDTDLADAVIQCFDLVGDEGNVTLIELQGPSKFEVERLDGYGIPVGFEDSCGPFYSKFINDGGTQSSQLDNPYVITYFGQIKDISICANLFEKLISASEGKVPNVLLCACGFSETVLGHLAVNFSAANKNINIYPMLVPLSPVKTGQQDFLADLAALTGSTVIDPIHSPLDTAELSILGTADHFEATRFRSNLIIDLSSKEVEERVFERVDELQKQLGSVATSEHDKMLLRERMGKLTGGIAKLKIYGASHGELREARDRAEDAVCAVRGALKHGVLPAGGYSLNELVKLFDGDNSPEAEILRKSLIAPVRTLYKNAGYSVAETDEVLAGYNKSRTYNILKGDFVDPWKDGLLDSTPAVLEAIRNAISIAVLLGTCGGTISYQRDAQLERKESIDVREIMKDFEE